MANFGSIRKLPSGNFQARYMIDGITYKAPTTFPTKGKARAWLTVEHAKHIQGIITDAPTQKPQLPYLNELAQQWLDAIKHPQSGYSPDTHRVYRSKWNAHLKDLFEGRRANDLTRADIIEWDKQKIWASQNLRVNTFRTLTAFFTWLVKQEIVKETPVKDFSFHRADEDRREKRVATIEQLQKIQEFMPPQLRIAVDLGCWCSLRFSEVAGLERRDIDLERGTVSVRRSTHRDESGKETVGKLKTRASYRTLHMPPAMIERMREHLDRYVGEEYDAPIVFNLSDNSIRLSNKHLHIYYNPAVAAAGLPGFRFHDLRHTGLTFAAQNGATLAELMARGGHSSAEVAMIYQTATLERDKSLAEKLGG